ncbi:hypothetical protein SAMN05660909_02243 [Chitinophaga terrae (ex Kim and Jung 2007)]|uniref:Uncharacterized protein n=1 Tax=Chitinophaga terrae (ex Kim and Jung 2007) TaxID=408074 RepID=A0A1H4BRF1_9BACT|nr:hypothetical protein [Chitinophaga terrae (ex Kim and Jung 2007)]MDQ0108702.1 hypothetical protein [Chitinophaga terrae (ex Kim and Jung 2007)]GEP89733.1 hypothetical protein CTE07_13780 [Chitinophaga terrae (ex Kim and Jung 2007)]SEA50746.1 hypothetical protein SAMN05660909_02243 [Chitinophaga terrae (ex Kim and Jung 2007)]
MKLRKEIEPQIHVAEFRYPKVLQCIMDYDAYLSTNDDEDRSEYTKLTERLQQLTGKDISTYNLWEWWEEEGAEVLAFRISLPAPKQVNDFSKIELTEVIRRMGSYRQPEAGWEEQTFEENFRIYLVDYYHELLKLNFKTYNYQKIFGPQRSRDHKPGWLTDEEKVAALWNDGNFK